MRRVMLLLAVLLGLAPMASAQETDPCGDVFDLNIDLAFFVGQGDVFFDLGNYTRAIERYSCAIRRDPTYVAAYVNRGYAYAVQGNYDLALADYDYALTIDAANVSAYNNRGVLYIQQGRFQLALTDFDLAIALAPDYAITYQNRGTTHAIEGNYDLALADFQQAITLDPDFAEPYASLGMVYSALAVASYTAYRQLLGDEQAPLPAGDADTVIAALEDSRISGNFSVWLPMLLPAR